MIYLIIVFLLVDRITKILAMRIASIKLIKNFLYLTYARNTGMAFSLLTDKTLLIIFLNILIIGYIIYCVIRNKPSEKLSIVGYSLILSGAFSNLLDRIIYGYVIDFIDVYIFGYDYPIFNLADSFIVIGVVLLLIGGYYDNNKCNRR